MISTALTLRAIFNSSKFGFLFRGLLQQHEDIKSVSPLVLGWNASIKQLNQITIVL